MERRTQLERIITGTLANNFSDVWPQVRTILYEGMFSDDFCRKAYNTMRQLANEGNDVNIVTLHQAGLDAAELYTIAADCDFPTLKWLHDWGRRLQGMQDTNVKLIDYIKTLTKYAARQKQEKPAL